MSRKIICHGGWFDKQSIVAFESITDLTDKTLELVNPECTERRSKYVFTRYNGPDEAIFQYDCDEYSYEFAGGSHDGSIQWFTCLFDLGFAMAIDARGQNGPNKEKKEIYKMQGNRKFVFQNAWI